MKKQKLLNFTRALFCFSACLAVPTAFADTVLTFDATPPGQFHNNPIIQSFGDNASSSGPGIVVTGIGTPDINLTWGATNNPNNLSSPSTRWDYYVFPGEPWSAGQLNQSKVGDYHDILFTPGNSAKVVVKSFNFHGYYGVLTLTGTNYQERFTYNWNVLDGTSLSSLAGGSYTFLSDSNKNHPVNINYTGATNQPLILRLSRVASVLNTGGDPIEVEGDPADIAIDDVTFSEEVGSATPAFSSSSLTSGQTNVAPLFAYKATLVDGFSRQVATNTIQLLLDGVLLSPTIGKTGLTTTITFNAGGLLRSGSTNTYEVRFSDNGGPSVSYTNKVTFVVQNYTSYEWRFTQGDLSTALGNGTMAYRDGDTPGLTSFGTTDGSTVPHINGVPAKFMRVPAFADDANGYFLYLRDTGPNVDTNAYVNRYTIIYDVLVPSPFDWLPFFNTDPFNLNDADFYVAPDASVGITAIYSSANIITGNTWNRIAFVADLAHSTMTYYVNGNKVASGSQGGSDVEGRWSLYLNQDLDFNQNPVPQFILFNEGDTSGVYTHECYVSSIAVADRVLNDSEMAALGGPSASGILARSFSPKPTLSIQNSNGQPVVSWPATYVGYALEQSDTILSPQWKPVPGITNNSVTLSSGNSTKFFRLIQ